MEDIKIDSSLSFGGYNWRVLDIQNNTALIITEDIIEQRAYHDAYKDITWDDCALRKYLNGEFYDKFNATDKSRIIPLLLLWCLRWGFGMLLLKPFIMTAKLIMERRTPIRFLF